MLCTAARVRWSSAERWLLGGLYTLGIRNPVLDGAFLSTLGVAFRKIDRCHSEQGSSDSYGPESGIDSSASISHTHRLPLSEALRAGDFFV